MWRYVVGSTSHLVSDQGEVFSGYHNKILTGKLNQDGYPSVCLVIHKIQKTLLVHHLVLEAFVGPKPEGLQARHLNDVKTDNRLENLVWGTVKENSQDAVRNGVHSMTRRTHCPQGHEYTDRNTYKPPSGGRKCRICGRENQRAK